MKYELLASAEVFNLTRLSWRLIAETDVEDMKKDSADAAANEKSFMANIAEAKKRLPKFAADLFKVALVRLDAALEEKQLASRVVLQVHDEVLVEVPLDEEAVTGDVVPSVMAGVADAVDLAVPLEVSAAWGDTWADAKG